MDVLLAVVGCGHDGGQVCIENYGSLKIYGSNTEVPKVSK